MIPTEWSMITCYGNYTYVGDIRSTVVIPYALAGVLTSKSGRAGPSCVACVKYTGGPRRVISPVRD